MIPIYERFFRNFVMRKKTQLVSAEFHSVSDITLPRDSAIHYLPRSPEDFGPSNEALFIGTFPGKVNIFFDPTYMAILGKTTVKAFTTTEAIKAYRKGHYKYIYARELRNVLNRHTDLLVNNLALGSKRFRYATSRFIFFEKSFNQFASVAVAANQLSAKTDRHQFLHIELPPVIPGYMSLQIAIRHYLAGYDAENNVPVPANNMLLPFKGYGDYWLMDWMLFMQGNYEQSLFGRFNEKTLGLMNIIFSYKGQAMIINLGILKEWLDQLLDKQGNPTTKRINVVKHMLLNFRRLVGTEQPIAEEVNDETVEAAGDETGESIGVDAATESSEGAGEETRAARPGKNDHVETPSNPGDLLADLFRDPKASDKRPDDTPPAESGSGNTRNDPNEWITEVADELLENVEEQTMQVVQKKIFVNPESGIERALAERANAGTLSVPEQAFFRKKATSYKRIALPNGQTIEEFIKIPEKHLRTIDATVAPELHTFNDPSMTQSVATKLKNNYAPQFLAKDIVSMILAAQRGGTALVDLKVDEVRNVQSEYVVYAMTVHNVNGSQSTPKMRIPIIQPDGTYKIDGVKRHMQLQRMEIPIRKINSHQVALTSYYDRHLMVTRSQKAVDDYGRALKKRITNETIKGNLSVILGRPFIRNLPAPRTYTVLSQQYQQIKIKQFTFSFDIVKLMGSEKAAREVATLETIPIGKVGNDYLILDDAGNVSRNGKDLGSLESLLGIDTGGMPVEIATININGFHFPLGVVLSYYFGIDELLKTLNANYRIVPAGERLKLSNDEYAITFSDESLIFDRRDRLSALIMGGMQKLPGLVNFSRYDLNSKGVWVPIMGNPRVKPGHFQEMQLVFDMFIDPITAAELERRHYPTEMHYLLLEAAKMLTNDYSNHEIEITEQRLVGYERFAGKVYSEIVRSTRQFRNKGNDRRHTFDMNPEAVMMNILTDTSANAVEEVNPIHEIKEQEGYTFGGTGGRSEETMVRRTRGQQENYKGIVSEAGKDSGKVGYVAYLTSNPKIVDYRGNVDVNMKDTDTGLLSVTGNLLYGSTIDDPKRLI